MKYEFKCPACGKTDIVECSMAEIKTLKPVCSDCGEETRRVFRVSLIVPENMKAHNVQDISSVNSSLNSMPSGKKRAIY